MRGQDSKLNLREKRLRTLKGILRMSCKIEQSNALGLMAGLFIVSQCGEFAALGLKADSLENNVLRENQPTENLTHVQLVKGPGAYGPAVDKGQVKGYGTN